MKALPFLFATVIVFAGCQAPQSRTASVPPSARPDFTVPEEEARSAEYPPKPADFRREIRRYFLVKLKDPDSAIYDGWMLARAYQGSNPPRYGWISSVSMNARNSHGGYTGFQVFHFWHENGQAQPVDNLPYRVHLVNVDLDEILKK